MTILKCNFSCRITLRTFEYLHIFISYPPQDIEEHTLNPFILNRIIQNLTSVFLHLQKFCSAKAQLPPQRMLYKEI